MSTERPNKFELVSFTGHADESPVDGYLFPVECDETDASDGATTVMRQASQLPGVDVASATVIEYAPTTSSSHGTTPSGTDYMVRENIIRVRP